MLRKQLAAMTVAATLTSAFGCASTWERSTSFLRPDSASEKADTAVAEKNSNVKTVSAETLSPEFKAAQKTFKNPETTLLKWAQYQEDIGEYAEARKLYRELQVAYPSNIDAHLGLARIEQQTGRNLQAEEMLTALAERYPKDVNVQLELGRLYTQLNNDTQSIRVFEKITELQPENQTCRYELGLALARTGQYDQALSHLTFAVGAPAANYNIGYILHQQGRNVDAAEWFQNALQSRPDLQTADRSRKMLAKLMPTEGAIPESAVAVRARTSHNAQAAIRPPQFPITGHTPAAPHEAPMMVSGRAATSRLAAQTQDSLLPAVDSVSPDQSTPFRAVSHSSIGATSSSSAALDSADLPQWNGPASKSLPPVQETQVSSPPLWRSRTQ
jgi:tetratricopeptide (TPR) repeat protein